MPEHVELILLNGAFQRLVALGPKDGVEGFLDKVGDLRRRAGKPKAQLGSLRWPRPWREGDDAFDVWARYFWKARGDVAHGRSACSKGQPWEIWEHVLLASYLFPLLVASKLHCEGFLAEEKVPWGEINVFEELADLKPFNVGEDENADEAGWARMVASAASDRSVQAVRAQIVAKGTRSDPPGSLEGPCSA